MPKLKFFKTQPELHKWFVKNHSKLNEQWIGFRKTSSGKKSITYAEALDEALSFGWIDGLRKSIDSQSYMIRYTPRKPKSIWSAVNIKRAGELIKLRLMQPAGLKTFKERDEKRANLYSYERENASLGRNFEKIFKQNKKAWSFIGAKARSPETRFLRELRTLSTLTWWARVLLIFSILFPSPVHVQRQYNLRSIWLSPVFYIYRWMDILMDSLRTLRLAVGGYLRKKSANQNY